MFQLQEDFPNLICLNCFNKITDIYNFKLLCDYSNALFLKYLESQNKADNYNLESEHKYRTVSNLLRSQTPDETLKNEIFDDTKIVLDNESKNNLLNNLNCKVSGKSCEPKKDQPCEARNDLTDLTSHDECHQQYENNPRHFLCEKCETTFESKSLLIKHIKKIHSKLKIHKNENEEINNFICEICRKPFKSKYILAVHEQRHYNKGQFLCTTCGKGFSSKGCLNRHMRVHTGEKKYECNICKKKFPSSNNLNLHFRIHSGVKPYLCTKCGKAFSHPTGLSYHMKTHTKEKNYKCDICEKSFVLRCHLSNHHKIHTGNWKFC